MPRRRRFAPRARCERGRDDDDRARPQGRHLSPRGNEGLDLRDDRTGTPDALRVTGLSARLARGLRFSKGDCSMNPKLGRLIGAAGLVAVALVPLAAAAASNGQAVDAIRDCARERIAQRARHLVRATERETAIVAVDETLISARVRTRAERETAAIAPEECPDWRLLATDAESRASDPSRVRICDVPVQDDESPAGARVAPVGPRATRSVMVFEHGPAEPGPAP